MRALTITRVFIAIFLLSPFATGADIDHPPKGWRHERTITISPEQCAQFSQSLGGKIESARNVFFAVGSERCQVNEIVCATEDDAKLVEKKLIGFKGDPTTVLRDQRTVFELVCQNALVGRIARYEFGFQPKKQRYEVRFDAVPLESCDYMRWNRLFNLFLRYDATPAGGRPAIEKEIEAFTKDSFEFGNTLEFRIHGQGDSEIEYSFEPEPKRVEREDAMGVIRYVFGDLPKKAGLPVVRVVAKLTSETYAESPAQKQNKKKRTKIRRTLQKGTERWPTDAKEVRDLAEKITKEMKTDEQKLAAILGWLSDKQNFRYAGNVTGSRYGVAKALEQGYGHCWDYSDVFVTLARANDIPTRQVLGWLHGVSGHVWSEVWIEGAGWRQVDPTSALGCGSDYVPYLVTNDGEISLVYASDVKIEILD